jgi:dihydroorotate dehydrogenase
MAEALALGRVFLERLAPPQSERQEQTLLGLFFPNPVGLAAGFDKDGEIVGAAARLGFGWIEVGTVTPGPQRGNPMPRLYRHREARSLENCMGFNNAGGEALKKRLQRAYPAPVPLGVNLGKNKDTPNAKAQADYLGLLEMFSHNCDYFVINVSSPNTPGLRDLQEREFLADLLSTAREFTDRPVFIKLSPDLETRAVVELVQGAVESGAAGAILTNTTARHSLLPGAHGVGGLSGEVLKQRSFELLETVASEVFGQCVLVSVGGVDSGREVYRRLRAGASLVQLYTALVYQGPRLLMSISDDLEELMARDGVGSLSEVVGADRR